MVKQILIYYLGNLTNWNIAKKGPETRFYLSSAFMMEQ